MGKIFKEGKTDVKDGCCPGQPKGATTKTNTAAVDVIKQAAGFTVKEIVKSGGISSGSVHKIVTKQLSTSIYFAAGTAILSRSQTHQRKPQKTSQE